MVRRWVCGGHLQTWSLISRKFSKYRLGMEKSCRGGQDLNTILFYLYFADSSFCTRHVVAIVLYSPANLYLSVLFPPPSRNSLELVPRNPVPCEPVSPGIIHSCASLEFCWFLWHITPAFFIFKALSWVLCFLQRNITLSSCWGVCVGTALLFSKSSALSELPSC